MPSKHNSLPSIIYLVIRLQCFDPLLGHHQAYIKSRKCIIFYILRAKRDPVWCTGLYRERRKDGEFNVVIHNISCASGRQSTRYVVCYYLQLSIFSSLPVQTVYNPVHHTGSRLARKI
jgi:hypothetical protein